MGRFTKKIVIFYCAILSAWLPVSVTAASIDCLFHEGNAISIENSISHSHHDSFVDLSDVDFGLSVDENSGQDASCSTHIIVAAVSSSHTIDDKSWIETEVEDTKTYQLTTVLLAQDIRPPISI
jgi:hypothetical protein